MSLDAMIKLFQSHPHVAAAAFAYWVLMGIASRLPAPATKKSVYWWFYQGVHLLSSNWDKISAALADLVPAQAAGKASALLLCVGIAFGAASLSGCRANVTPPQPLTLKQRVVQWENDSWAPLNAAAAAVDQVANEYNSGAIPKTQANFTVIRRAQQSKDLAVQAFSALFVATSASNASDGTLQNALNIAQADLSQFTAILGSIKALEAKP